MQKDPLVTFMLSLTNMSDQTNAVKVCIGTKNHFVNIFIMYFLLLVVVMNSLLNSIYSLPFILSPLTFYQQQGVQSGSTFIFIWRS